ncbi:MAG: hypothetical protein ACK56F_01330, partial [bacterium]
MRTASLGRGGAGRRWRRILRRDGHDRLAHVGIHAIGPNLVAHDAAVLGQFDAGIVAGAIRATDRPAIGLGRAGDRLRLGQ